MQSQLYDVLLVLISYLIFHQILLTGIILALVYEYLTQGTWYEISAPLRTVLDAPHREISLFIMLLLIFVFRDALLVSKHVIDNNVV